MSEHDNSTPARWLPILIAASLGGCADRGAPEATEAAASRQAVTTSATPGASAKPAARSSTVNTANTPSAKFAPGQLIVKFKSDEKLGVTDDVQTWLARGRSFATATADGSPSLDARIARHGIFRASSLVQGREGLSTQAAKARLRDRAKRAAWGKLRHRAAPIENLVNVYRLDLPDSADLQSAMQDLRRDPHVEYVHPNYIAKLTYTPDDPYFASSGSWGQPRADLWDLDLMRTESAWDTSRGSGVVVAVVDTGVDIGHPDLAGNVWSNPGEIPDNGVDDDGNGYIDDVHGWNFLYDNNMTNDGVGHGTHVAGTIAAQDNNGLGIVGVAPDARIMPVSVFAFRTETTVFQLSQGVLYAAQNGADVINNSWDACGSDCSSVGVVEDAVRVAHAAGSVVVFAAGNDSRDIAAKSPQNQPEAIVVSATTPNDTLASFSNFGLVDLAAPGAGDPNDPVVEPERGILSLRAEACVDPWICNSDRNVGDAYVRLSGTSMAAPHVSGAAALVLGLHPTYSPEQVRQVLRRTSVDANGNGYDSHLGYGRVDTAQIAAESTPLEALIQLPLLVRSSQVPVAGSANGEQFQRYVLEFGAGILPTSWTTITSASNPIQSGLLGTWNASSLPDGTYTFRLTATKADGTTYDDLHQLTLDRVALISPEPQSLLRGGDIAITGIANPGTFQSYAIRVQTFEAGTPVNAAVTLTNGGQQPVDNGVLAVWHTQNMPAGHYQVVLEVTNTDGSVVSKSVMVIVDSLLNSNFPVELTHDDRFSNQPVEPIAMVDLDNDGRSEILAGWAEKVSIFKGDGTLLAGWPQLVKQPDGSSSSLRSMPVAGDIDGDGVKEVVAANSAGTIFVWGSNGVSKPGWPRSITGAGWASLSLSLADVDRNGVLDVVATDPDAGIHALRGNGTYLPGWPVTAYAGIRTPATVADLNKDGKNEVVVGIETSPARLVVLSARGSILQGWPQTLLTSGNDSSGSYPVVGDLDDDGDLEIAVVTSDWDPANSKVAIYHHNGQQLRSWSTGATQMGPLVLADVDGDGSLEILSSLVHVDNTGALYVWDRFGNVLPGWPQFSPGSMPTFNAPIVVDLDGDARNEIIAARAQEFWSENLQQRYGYPVQAFRHDGTPIADMIRPAYGAWFAPDASPGVADIDGDGRLELVWTEIRDQGLNTEMPWPRLLAWDLATPASNAQPWPMYRGDARRSGVAPSVVPIVRLTQRNVPRRIDGLARFQIRTGYNGVIQIKHPWQAVVKYAVGSHPLKQTTLGWGDQFTVGPFKDVVLRVVTTSPLDVTIDWW